ncbi:MAG: flagellar motor switch protein FliG [Pseudomonadota bacterium]
MSAAAQRHTAGARRSAILLLSLGEEVAVRLMRHLGGDELRAISDAARHLGQVTAQDIEGVLEQFAVAMTGPFVGPGGGSYLHSLAVRAVGPERADLLLGPAPAPSRDPDPLADCAELNPGALATLIEREHPQIAALVLAALAPQHAVKVFNGLKEDVRSEVLARVARLENIKPELVREIGETLLAEVRAMSAGGSMPFSGPTAAAAVLKATGRRDEVLERIAATDPQLAAEIKKRLFTFDDIADMASRSVQQVLRSIDGNTLSVALRSAPAAVKEKFFCNMSSRAAEMLQEDLSAMGPVRIADVEKAHEEIVSTVMRLAEEGTIALAMGDDLV